MEDIGRSIHINGKAVFGSKPWLIYGDNLNSGLREIERNIVNADVENVMKKVHKENFNTFGKDVGKS